MFDLSRIVGRKSYQVAMPPEELFKEIENFLCPLELFEGCKEWRQELRKGERSRTFRSDFVYDFIVKNARSFDSTDELIHLKDKCLEDSTKNFSDFIERKRGNLICELDILITDIDEMGCICRANSKPFIYFKLSRRQISLEDVTEFMIQDAYYEGLRFLDEVFIGGLRARPIEEAPMISHKFELLINITARREITERIDSLLDEATGEILICGWIGTYFIPKFKDLKSKGVKIRFITHKPQKARNQPWKREIEEAYSKLCSDIGLDNICIDPNIHGRMVIIDNKALIGSMDLNSSSLTGPHTEFAIYTDEPEIVRRLRRQFNAKFKPLKED